MSYLSNFFVSIDQLGNVLAGGNPDNTISSRVGYYNNKHDGSDQVASWQWRLFEKIIDFSFWPIDGDNHCHEAYHNDAGEKFDDNTSNILIAIAAIFIIISCIPISILLYLSYAIGLVSPKRIDRTKNIKNRLESAQAKLKGTLNELNEFPTAVDNELKNKSLETVESAKRVSEKIIGILP